MVKKLLVVVAILGVAAGVWFGVPQVREPWEWDTAQKTNTAEGYRTYLAVHAGSENARRAWALYDDRLWVEAKGQKTVEACEAYLAVTFPVGVLPPASQPAEGATSGPSPTEGRYAAEARAMIDDLRFAAAAKAHTVPSYSAYLEQHPTGRHAAEATKARDDLRWAAAAKENTIPAFETYLKDEPAGQHVEQAKVNIEDLVWFAARRAGTVEALTGYLEKHPQGAQVGEARKLRDRARWKVAQETGTSAGYEAYLADEPEGFAVAEAREALDDLAWKSADLTRTIESYRSYLGAYSKGRHVADANRRLDDLQWDAAVAANTVLSYQQYQESTPDGTRTAQAKARIEGLLKSDEPLALADKAGTAEAYEQFLANYPGHAREADARRRLAEIGGLPLLDLVGGRSVAYEARGAGVDGLALRLKRSGTNPVTVRIPYGTFFESTGTAEGKPQNLLVRESVTVTLDKPEWTEVPLKALGLNPVQRGGSASDVYTLRPKFEQPEVAKLLPVIVERQVAYPVAQVATWMVAANADRAALLAAKGASGLPPSDDDLVRALQVLTWSTIPVQNRAVWADRAALLAATKDEALRKWLTDAAQMAGK